MSYADILIVTIIVVFATTYGVFNYMYAQGSIEDKALENPGMNYTSPNSDSFFNTVDEVRQINVDNPEIWFVNSILFSVMGFLVVFLILRFARGTG